MSTTSQRSNVRKRKELKVLELYQQGLSYKKIAKQACLSLREVSKYIHRISNNRKSPSVTSIHDEIILEYRVNMLRSEVKNLESQKEKLKNQVADLRAEIWDIQYKLRAKQSELESVTMNLYCERLSGEVLEGIFS